MTFPLAPNSPALLEDRPEPAALAHVEEMLRTVGRAIRAHQLYLHNNPTYLRSLDTARGSFAAIWAHTDELTLEVTDTQLRLDGWTVLNEPDKTADALPWTLYKDGLRELRLLRGVEQTEIVVLIDILARVRRAQPDVDDLLTLLWEQEFSCVRYRYVDVVLEGLTPFEIDEGIPDRIVDPAQLREPAQESVLPSGVVNLDDFDSTLYFLDEREVEYLRNEVKKEYASDLRGNVVSILLDVYEQQSDDGVRGEICEHLESFLVNLLAMGELRTVAHILQGIAVASARARELTATQRQRLQSIPERMSEPQALSQLLQSLEDRTELPAQEELNELFDELRVGALGTIFAWLSRMQSPRLRLQLEGAAARLAAANSEELLRLIGSSEHEVSLEAVRRAGAMRAAQAVPALARLLTQEEQALRLAAVQALAEIGTPGALQQLERVIDDPVREVRVAVMRAVATRTYRPALTKLEIALKGKRLGEADLTEKMVIFEAYGALCGDQGVALLDGILNGRSLFGKREDPELRACAAMALGKVSSSAAMDALRRASNDKEILVRNAVNRTLRGGAA